MSDLIERQAAIEALRRAEALTKAFGYHNVIDTVRELPSAQPEPHYCRECKWSRCHINIDKYGETETYWHCLNWDGGTDEEGFCYEWERRIDE